MLYVCFYSISPMQFVYGARVRSEADAKRMAKCDNLQYTIISEL